MPRGKLKADGIKTNAELQEQVKTLTSVMQTRLSLASLLGQTHAGARDIYSACGWKKTLEFNDYYNHYRRSNVAGTVVDLMPEECFSSFPEINENAEQDETPWEKDFLEIAERVKLFPNLLRADKFAGIYQYSVLLLGFADGKTLDQPVENGKDLLYVKPYLQCNAKIYSTEKDTKNKRYGQPLMYELITEEQADGSTTTTTALRKVHYSRIIHIAENPVENTALGTPRLERVFNNIENIVKISGSGAEAQWRGAFPGLGLVMDKDAKMTDAQVEAMKDEVTDYENNLSRTLKLKGITPTPLDNTPSGKGGKSLDDELKLIAFTLQIPKRILEGSERGELSSGQDKDKFDEKIKSRRVQFVEPEIIRATIDRLIEHKVLKEAVYAVDWKDLNEVSAKDKSDNNKTKTETLTIYAKTPEAQEIVPPELFLAEFLGLDDETVKAILDAAAKFQKDEEAEMAADVKTIQDEKAAQNPVEEPEAVE